MGKAVSEADVSAGLQLVPVSFSAIKVPDGKIEICDREIRIHVPSESEQILLSIIKDYPDLIVVDYTVPAAVNGECVIKCYESWVSYNHGLKKTMFHIQIWVYCTCHTCLIYSLFVQEKRTHNASLVNISEKCINTDQALY
jgi:hypothetical protein